jgi:lysophospholipase L1-like esterase
MKMAVESAARKITDWAALGSVVCTVFGVALAGCSKDATGPVDAQDGSSEKGGATGGSGAGNGGANTTGGASNGGTASGGTTAQDGGGTGGRSTGGTDNAGTGGKGGANGGGASNGGASNGGASGGKGGQGGSSHSGPWKVMMLGDSITAATCYPQLVSKGLLAAGRKNFQFIGTQTNQQSCSATQVSEEGHGGYGVTYLPQNSTREACQKPACGSYTELQTWATEKPDIVLMHYGTNDVWDGQSPSNILSAYLAVIAEFRKQNSSVIFFVSKIIKLNPSGCTNCLNNVAALAAALTDSWATSNSTATSPIWIVDNYDSGFDPNDKMDSGDGVHPALAGAQKSADATVLAVIAENYF